MTNLVLTLIGPDRPGLVESVADCVTAHGGNWLESRMARLAGQFAGILRVETPPENLDALQSALQSLESQGLRVVAAGATGPTGGATSFLVLEAVGADHPGIVRDIAHVLARYGVNIEALTTDRLETPMSGGGLFRAQARLQVPAGLDVAKLRGDLEHIANDLMIDLTLAPPGESA